MADIVQSPHKTLRVVAEPVKLEDIGSKKLVEIIEKMKKALHNEEDGVAIAAPQIDEALCIFVVSQKAIPKAVGDTVFINPKIVRLGKKKEMMSEGCLSVRWKYGLVKRSTTATVKALNEQGNEFVMSGKGLLAQIFQHETDHLNGVLFIDKATNIEDLPPETKSE
ncbi:MAG: peptide deformylase [Patescibacteria group bacterium]